MVMMCRFRVSLMRSMIAARVVDLPDPVGPVTSTSPRSDLARRRTCSGMPSWSRVMILVGMTRKTAPDPRCWWKRFTRKRASPGIS